MFLIHVHVRLSCQYSSSEIRFVSKGSKGHFSQIHNKHIFLVTSSSIYQSLRSLPPPLYNAGEWHFIWEMTFKKDMSLGGAMKSVAQRESLMWWKLRSQISYFNVKSLSLDLLPTHQANWFNCSKKLVYKSLWINVSCSGANESDNRCNGGKSNTTHKKWKVLHVVATDSCSLLFLPDSFFSSFVSLSLLVAWGGTCCPIRLHR